MAAWDPWEKETLPTLDQLARSGADLDLTDYQGVTPLTKAWANKEHVITLIQHGCQVNTKTHHNLEAPSFGFSLLELAAMEGNFRIVHALRVAGFNATDIDFSHKRGKYQKEYDDLYELCSQPLALRDICRLNIRKSLKRNIFKKIEHLPLPMLLKNILCMKDL